MPIVEIHNLTHRYGQRIALDDFSLQVNDGDIFGFLGPNGSGKTTLFRILSALIPVAPGYVRLFGLDAAEARDEIRRQIGVVFQSPSLDKQLTAEENLICQGHLYGLRGADLRGRVEQALAAVGLGDRAAERVDSFSGGMRRRVEVAKGLLHRPRVLLLDEPSTGLDPAARIDMWRHLREINQRDGVTILVTTHLMEEADRCTRLAVLAKGRLVAADTPAALKERIGGEQAAFGQHGQARAAVGFLHQVRRHENGDAIALVDFAQVAPHVDAGCRIEAGAGFVEQQDARAMEQSLGDLDAPAHAAAETLDALGGAVAQADRRQRLLDAPAQIRAAQAVEMSLADEIFLGGQLLVEAWRLEYDADLPADFIARFCRVQAEQAHMAGGDGDERREDAEEGGLARAVGAKKAEDIAVVDLQGEVVQGNALAVTMGEVVDFYDRHCETLDVSRASRPCGLLSFGKNRFSQALRTRHWRDARDTSRHFYFDLRMTAGRSIMAYIQTPPAPFRPPPPSRSAASPRIVHARWPGYGCRGGRPLFCRFHPGRWLRNTGS